MDAELLTCSVCLSAYNSSEKRPFDLGCGHSFCEACIKASPRSFRYCPECRARASNPHANIALLRLLDAMDPSSLPQSGAAAAAGTGSSSSSSSSQQQQQQPQQPPRHQQPIPSFGPSGIFKSPGLGGEPVGTLGSLLNQVSAVVPAGAAAAAAGGGSNAQNPVVALPGSLATHKANIAQMRTTMWTYLTPLMGMLYIVSPLDFIPDFLPLVGWIDDALVLIYIVTSLYQVFQARSPGAQHPSDNSRHR